MSQIYKEIDLFITEHIYMVVIEPIKKTIFWKKELFEYASDKIFELEESFLPLLNLYNL